MRLMNISLHGQLSNNSLARMACCDSHHQNQASLIVARFATTLAVSNLKHALDVNFVLYL